MKPGACYRV